ncbi:MAG: glycosyltransferase family 2 protein [Clostridia bacterium]|nr:glycosyltransferase family 2 protein [Clostridia bacterium]
MDSLVSIIIPVYNVEKYLPECLESVINQTYKNLEILLIDDGSPDNSGKICDEYAEKDARIKVIHKENGGVSSARNLGLNIATGEYITFIDSDDFVDEHYVEYLYNDLTSQSSDMSFCGFSKHFGQTTEKYEECFPNKLNIDFKNMDFERFFHSFFQFNNTVFGSIWRVLYKKDVIKNILFNSNIKISEDLVFVLNCIFKCKSISHIEDSLYFYRVNNQSACRSYKRNYLQSQLALADELKKLFCRFDDGDTEKLFDTYRALLCYYCFSNEIKFKGNTNRRENIGKIRKSELYRYFNLKNCVKIDNFKAKIKFLIVWGLVKLRLM